MPRHNLNDYKSFKCSCCHGCGYVVRGICFVCDGDGFVMAVSQESANEFIRLKLTDARNQIDRLYKSEYVHWSLEDESNG